MHVYGLDISYSNLLQDYLSNPKERTKVGSSFVCWVDILSGVPRVTILGPLLFNISLCNMFLISKTVYFTVYTDDNIPFEITDNIYIYIFFFSIWVFFHEHSQITGLQGKGEGISLTPHYHFHPLHRHLDISRVITAESSTLHIASSWTWTENVWFPSASH